MSVNFYGYKPTVRPQANNTKNVDTPQQQPKVSKTTIVTGGVIAGAGIAAGILTKGKGGEKVVETLSKKLPELETKAKKLWGRLTGSTKKAEEARKAQEQAEAARKRAEEWNRHLEELDRAEKEAIAKRKQELEEAARLRELKKAEEAAKKAELQRAAEAAKKAEKANHSFKYNSENRVKSFLNPEAAISETSRNNIKRLENEDWDSYYKKLSAEKEKLTNDFDVYSFVAKVEKTSPEDAFKPIFEEFEKCHQNGGTATVDDAIKILENSRSIMDSGVRFVEKKNRFESYDLKAKYNEYNKYLDEVIAELKANKSSGENPATIVRTSVSNIENRKNAAIAARNAVLEKISQSYESQLAPIRERIHYDEVNIPPIDKEYVELNSEVKQNLADELNKILESGGANPNFTADTPLSTMTSAWRNKYISIPFSMKNKEGEKAILDMFPRYESGIFKMDKHQWEFNKGDFKYEPLYRQMHIENPEEFVKQFENIGGEYAPGRLQSCSKEKYYGECWGGIECPHYGFAEWSPKYNVKFVIHPKGPVTNAAEIGEGKYGNYEAIYDANQKFRILGTIKKTVTPEEMQKNMRDFKNKFEDFEKYEIHLQEM